MLDAMKAAAIFATYSIGAQSIAQAPSPGTEINQTVRTSWDELTDVVIGNSMASASDGLLATVGEQFRKDANFIELEAEYPGLIDSVLAGIRPMIRQEAARIIPLYRRDLRDLYASSLTSNEAQQAAVFFRTPAMQHFIALLEENRSFASTAQDIFSGHDVSQQAMSHDISSSAIQASLKMDGNEYKRVTDFFRGPVGQKLTALNARKQAVDAKWTNYISPEGEKEIEPAVMDNMIAHVGKSDPEVARKLAKELKRPYNPAP